MNDTYITLEYAQKCTENNTNIKRVLEQVEAHIRSEAHRGEVEVDFYFTDKPVKVTVGYEQIVCGCPISAEIVVSNTLIEQGFIAYRHNHKGEDCLRVTWYPKVESEWN